MGLVEDHDLGRRKWVSFVYDYSTMERVSARDLD
jgi:hypothetical protein